MRRSKLWLVVKREYLTRVRKKSFLYITLLTPLAFLFFFVIVGVIFSYESGDKVNIVISDPSKMMGDSIKDARRFNFEFSTIPAEQLKEHVEEGKYQALVQLPPMEDPRATQYDFNFYSDEPLDLEASSMLNRRIQAGIKTYKIKALEVDPEIIDLLDVNVNSRVSAVTEQGKEFTEMTSVVAAALGGIMGYVLFFVILLFGAQVMRSVTEEKINRIVFNPLVKSKHISFGFDIDFVWAVFGNFFDSLVYHS